MSDGLRFPWDLPAAPVPPPADPDPDAPAARPKRRGRRPAAPDPGPPWRRIARTGWFHHLTISGPAATVDAFAAAARGSGITPWQLDYAAIEDDIFVRAVSQPASRRSLTVEGCRILARQFREKVEMRQARAAALVGQSLACPFDLHALLPVPRRSCFSDPRIRRRWPGWRRTGASPTGCARSACATRPRPAGGCRRAMR